MAKKILVFLVAGIIVAGMADGVTARIKPIRPRLRPSSMSTQQLISSANYLFTQSPALYKSTQTSIDTIRILAIKVEFQKDDDDKTTGDGTFDLSTNSDYIVDAPPHNNSYFEAQLLALANYFRSVSHDKLILLADVYPRETDRAFTLPNKMAYYNPNTTDEELDSRLAELFRDAWESADRNDSIPFAKYQSFIVFHAGVGSEYTLELDSTPNDIPSVFLNINDLQKALAQNDPNYAGIAVSGYHIREGIILPETESQMGYDIGMLGTMTLMFGHQLGLPNLYDTDTGHPGIGVFGMMDQGSANFSGLIPAQPCAWSKIFLGWEEAIEISHGTDFEVAAALANHPNKIYKIPINDSEYYLIENRQRHVLRSENTSIGYDQNGLRIQFTPDGDITTPNTGDKIGVITQVEEYDFGLPGSGILIWHINERVIAEHYAENRVNVDMYNRGVDLVEADGAQDIGHFYNFFGITGYESGTEWDFWWNGNDAFSYANDSADVALTPFTMPNSNTASGARSNISITNFSDRQPIMTFSLEQTLLVSGFPYALGQPAQSIQVGDIDGQAGEEIVVTVDGNAGLALRADGTRVIANTDSIVRTDYRGKKLTSPQAIFATYEGAGKGVALEDLNGDGKADVILSSTEQLTIVSADDQNSDGRADELATTGIAKTTTPPIIIQADRILAVVGNQQGYVFAVEPTSGSIAWSVPVANQTISGMARYSHSGDDSLVAVADGGTVALLSADGSVLWSIRVDGSEMQPPVVGDLNADGKLDIVVFSANGNVSILSGNGDVVTKADIAHSDGDIFTQPVLGDLDGNSILEIVVGSLGQLWAFQYTINLVENFPIELRQYDKTDRVFPPAVLDLDDDGDMEIIYGVGRTIYAFHHTGQRVEEFPLSVGAWVTTAPVIADPDDDGQLNVFVGTKNFLYNWNLPFEYKPLKVAWGNAGSDKHNSNMIAVSETAGTGKPPGELMPAKTVYNWPNPNNENFTFIHYWLRENANVSIRIYDMAGDLVDEMQGSGYGGSDNSVRVDLSNIQSGVYLVRVEASNANEKNVAFFKMAVLK